MRMLVEIHDLGITLAECGPLRQSFPFGSPRFFWIRSSPAMISSRPVIAGHMVHRFGAKFRLSQKSELSNAVGDADQHHAFLRELLAVVAWLGSRSEEDPRP